MTNIAKHGQRLKICRKYFFVYGMIAIAIIQFAIFYVWTNINSILMAFQYYDTKTAEYFWSTKNFSNFITKIKMPNAGELVSIVNTLKYFGLNLLFLLPASYFISYFLYKKIKCYKFFRVLFFLPSIISAVVFVTVYKNILKKFGPIDEILNLFGLNIPPLLASEKTATPTIMFYTIWTGFGVNMLLYQSAMSRVPQEVIEAGQLDGISWIRELLFIITPMVWPTISTTIILQMTGIFNSTGPILLFAEAGTVGGAFQTSTLSYWFFAETNGGNYNYPAAIGIIMTLVSFPIVIFVRWVVGKIDPGVEY